MRSGDFRGRIQTGTQVSQPFDDIRREFGEMDIYVFDQFQRGRITDDMRLLDAGCGHGRNLVYPLRRGMDVWGVDGDVAAVAEVRRLAASLAPHLKAEERFRVETVEAISFDDASFDVVLSSAVLHFARDEAHWWAMLRQMWRVLSPDGLFFARLATNIGLESRMQALGNGRYRMPDGSERFLVDEAFIVAATAEVGGTLMDPLKTSVVQDRRSMMTWVMRKARG